MEIRKEEEEEKEEEIEEEREEEEKEESQEDEKEPKKDPPPIVSPPKNFTLKKKKQEEEDEKIPSRYKPQNPYETPIKEKEEIQTQEQTKEEEITPENQEQDLEPTSTYILKYTRKGDELKEIAEETGLRKSENCLFMLNIKLIKSDSISIIDPLEEKKEIETPKEPENFLVFCCHEIAAIYFDEIYERIYTLKDLASENKYFKVFESTEEAKMVIDETIRTNEKNAKKIFIGFKDKELKLHMKLSFFDKEKEIVLNIPKKPLSDEDKVNLLPEFLKEIQDKMNHLNEENKKLKARKLSHASRSKENKYNYKIDSISESVEIEKEKKDKSMSINNKDIQFNEINRERINSNISSNINNNSNININNNNGNSSVRKKSKKLKVKKKHSKPEENFF